MGLVKVHTSRLSPFTYSGISTNRAWRYNNREDMNDSDRFIAAMKQIVGRRLTYRQLIGKDASAVEAF
jgi:hypothetical protein